MYSLNNIGKLQSEISVISSLLLLTFLPVSVCFVNCPISCRRCKQRTEHPEILEVYCAMCNECKQRRRELRLGLAAKQNPKGLMRTTTEEVIVNPPCATIPPCPSSSEETIETTLTTIINVTSPKPTTTPTTHSHRLRPCKMIKPKLLPATISVPTSTFPPMQTVIPIPVPIMPMQIIPMPLMPMIHQAPIPTFLNPEYTDDTVQTTAYVSPLTVTPPMRNSSIQKTPSDYFLLYFGVPKNLFKTKL